MVLSRLLYCVFIFELLWTGQTIFERAWAKVDGAYHVIIEPEIGCKVGNTVKNKMVLSRLLYCVFFSEILLTGQTIFERAWGRAKVGGAYRVIIELEIGCKIGCKVGNTVKNKMVLSRLLYCIFIFKILWTGQTIFERARAKVGGAYWVIIEPDKNFHPAYCIALIVLCFYFRP